MSRFVFGPVPSRRLGFSLGVDIIPKKYCSFDCIYCQIGKTTNKEILRKGFFNPYEIVKEVIEKASISKHIDFITFSGSGEPTLNSNIGLMINEIKKRINIPVSVITNGSLLFKEDVRNDLKTADIVLPSLDAASEDIFRYINRPHSLIELSLLTKGLKEFRDEYRGKIWLEIMLIKGINDDIEELKKFKDILKYLNVDKIQLNTVTRPPSEEIKGRIKKTELEEISKFFGNNCEVICTFEKIIVKNEKEDWTEMVLDILKRRSLSLDDIVKITGVSFSKAKNQLHVMEKKGKIKSFHFGEGIFYLKNE
ncbi:MAG: radical SAM protein [Proteobacteria bacterium]|nr:radical SAM protein [Pseudomonadota bacterium]